MVAATLGLAAASWVVAVSRMNGMDMGVATALGSFPVFVILWMWIMAATMLPGARSLINKHSTQVDQTHDDGPADRSRHGGKLSTRPHSAPLMA